MGGYAWTKREARILVKYYGRLPITDLASLLKTRTIRAIHQQAMMLGVAAKKNVVTKKDLRELKRLHRLGWTDSEVAKHLGHDRHTISDHRNKLGLAPNTFSDHRRRCVAEKTKEQLVKMGLKSMGEIRKQAFRRFAVENGWPPETPPRGVQLLNVLASAGKPLTIPDLCELIGCEWAGRRSALKYRGQGGTYLTYLTSLGLVASPGWAWYGGQGKRRKLYTLGPEAVRILQERADGKGNIQSAKHREENADGGPGRSGQIQSSDGDSVTDRRKGHGGHRGRTRRKGQARRRQGD